jgi:5-methylcytosine-specific restriction endonuclease McrA
MAVSDYTCEVCKKAYEPSRNKDGSLRKVKYKVCSVLCRNVKNGRTSSLLSEYRQSIKNPNNYFTCIQCGNEAYRDLSGTSRRKGYINKYCSMQCKLNHAAKIRSDREKIKNRESVLRLARKSLIRSLRNILRDKVKQQALTNRLNRLCESCGNRISHAHGLKKYCDLCIQAKANNYRKEYRNSDKFKESRRAYKHYRRAIERGVDAEIFNPVEILMRDGWKCQICGISTPKNRRGTYYKNAPELDHIIPLSKGGKHIKANVQCACRACNGAKSNKVVIGQMGLFAA